MFKIIVVSLPVYISAESDALNLLARHQEITALHLRKPHGTQMQMHHLLQSLPASTLQKIRLHNHYHLIREFPLQGLHLTSLRTSPANYRGARSASCHNLDEVKTRLQQGCDYVFLSPVFDSISKKGYKAAFTEDELRKADLSRVVALGGITPDKIPQIKSLGFGGAALLGGLWGDYATAPDLIMLNERLNEICSRIF